MCFFTSTPPFGTAISFEWTSILSRLRLAFFLHSSRVFFSVCINMRRALGITFRHGLPTLWFYKCTIVWIVVL